MRVSVFARDKLFLAYWTELRSAMIPADVFLDILDTTEIMPSHTFYVLIVSDVEWAGINPCLFDDNRFSIISFRHVDIFKLFG